ncbi:MAG: hypothetical protein AAGN82_27920 [Myxococcota bacterium]
MRLTARGAPSPFRATVRLDVMLQARSRLYAIGLVVAVVLGLLLRRLFDPPNIGRALAGAFVLGVGGTTFMFGASMLLLARSEGTLAALRTSGISTRVYLGAKVLTLTGFALVESAIIFVLAAFDARIAIAPLLFGLVVLGAFYTLVGIGLAASHRVVTTFLFPWATAVATILQLPVLSLVEVGPSWLHYAIPTQAPLLAVRAAFEPLTGWQWVYVIGVSVVMVAGSAGYCDRRFRRHVRLGDPRGTETPREGDQP